MKFVEFTVGGCKVGSHRVDVEPQPGSIVTVNGQTYTVSADEPVRRQEVAGPYGATVDVATIAVEPVKTATPPKRTTVKASAKPLAGWTEYSIRDRIRTGRSRCGVCAASIPADAPKWCIHQNSAPLCTDCASRLAPAELLDIVGVAA